jgi:hypothetical protein
MKANDLYKEITNHMGIPLNDATSFKKRLAGYFIEFKLQKKRFSDAYYYFGIIPKEPSKLNLDEIEEKRLQDKKTWFKHKDLENTSNLFENKIKERETLLDKMIYYQEPIELTDLNKFSDLNIFSKK